MKTHKPVHYNVSDMDLMAGFAGFFYHATCLHSTLKTKQTKNPPPPLHKTITKQYLLVQKKEEKEEERRWGKKRKKKED